MDVRRAKREVLTFLQSELDRRGEPGKYTPHIELWTKYSGHVGIRVAEVDFTFGEPGTVGSGGGSFMQVDVPHGLTACAATERLMLALCDGTDTEEIEDAKWRLRPGIWGEEE
mgnify:CR=1 FL=1